MSKTSNSVGRNDNFLAMARKLSILPNSLGSFDIRQYHVGILYLHVMPVNMLYKNGPNAYAYRTDVDQPARTAKNRISFINAHNTAYLIIKLAFLT